MLTLHFPSNTIKKKRNKDMDFLSMVEAAGRILLSYPTVKHEYANSHPSSLRLRTLITLSVANGIYRYENK